MIRRVHERPHGWVIIDRRAVDDARLSWAARGLLAYLLARPDDWHVRPAHLATQAGSAYQVRQLLRELEATGYAELSRRRRPDGTFGGSRWIIHEGGFAAEGADPPSSPDVADPRDPETPAPGLRRLSADHALPTKEELPKKESSATDRVSDMAHLGASDGETNAAAGQEKRDLERLLTNRGVDAATASALADAVSPEVLRRHVERYDTARLDGRVQSVGWLVEALRRNPQPVSADAPLLEPRAAIDYVERRGFSLNATRTLDHYFERVPTDDGLRLRPRREVFAHAHG